MNSIPKIYRFGERLTQGILDGPVVIEEKYDGSQFTFGAVKGELVCRSKSTILDPNTIGMFGPAIDTARALFNKGFLNEGWLYLCEFLAKEKHNVLKYSRVPKGFLVLYDCFRPDLLEKMHGQYMGWCNPKGKRDLAECLGLEPALCLHEGPLSQFELPAVEEKIRQYESSLGGCKMEGIVIKNYHRPHAERPNWPLTAKIVSEQFKEKIATTPRNPKAGPGEFVQRLINSLRTEARWLKAVQHLKEAGELKNWNADIGPLCREVQRDVLDEEAEWIKQQLFEEFSKEILRGTVNGFAQWYQNKLAANILTPNEQQT